MSLSKKTASFGRGRANEITLGEAHALASLHGDAEAAAAVHQLIATCAPDAGFKVLAYPCRYNQHYSASYQHRRWDSDAALGMASRLHDLARLAIANRGAIEAIHAKHFGNYTTLGDDERLQAQERFRAEMNGHFG